MAAYIPVPRDLTRVKTKVFFNLTKRQLLCFGAAALIGVPIFFLVKATGNVSLAALSMMIVMLPLFFLAMYEKDSQPLEVVVEHFIQTKFVRPKVRPYQTDNYYDALMRQYKLEKEVERIVFQKEATGKKHQNACKSESEAGERLGAQLEQLLEGVLSNVTSAGNEDRLTLEVDAACLQHVLQEVDIAVACGLRTDERTAKLLAFTREDAHKLVG